VIDLGTMSIRDQDSITDVRGKILGLLRALGADDVLATRTATAVSESARRYLLMGGVAQFRVGLLADEDKTRLVLQMECGGPPPDPSPLRAFFDAVKASASDPQRGAITAELALPARPAAIDERLIRQERARIERKSRSELVEELRLKNRQLEEHNESLEVTVAERTSDLRAVNERMRRDLDAGAAYVRGLIPEPRSGAVSIDWRYVPSSSLGGDTIGYHRLDDDHLALYLVDVTGHGLDAALLSVTVANVIRSGSLPGTDMKRPDEVLASLNDAFQSDQHGDKFFTIWYGVYEHPTRTLTWSGGGHHPAVLLERANSEAVLLESSGPLIGAAKGMGFPAESRGIPEGSRLLVFSDGAFEIIRDGKPVWNLHGLIRYLADQAAREGTLMDSLLDHARRLRGAAQLDDDFSIIEARFV
jgi:serine phosphatase RsbU (regulator of sigma subunit)